MEPTIIAQGEMMLVGMADEGRDIHGLWMRFLAREGEISHAMPGAAYEVHTHAPDATPTQLQECFVGVQVTSLEEVPAGMVVKRLPAAHYAVFTHRLANGGYTGANAAMNAWLHTGPYHPAHNYSLQRFDARFNGGNQPDSGIDFFIPVVAKG